ncbi:MAG: hypothetical protein V4732_05330 [Pseudomonadota bacterium]
MITSLALAVALWPAQVTQYCTPPSDTLIVGIAYNNHKEFLYCEWFNKVGEKKIRASYVREANTFAVKYLDFSTSSLVPNVTQLDSRSGELREASTYSKQVVLKYRENKNQEAETANLPIDKVDVLDAGFNDFVQLHWDKLIAGNALPVNFGSIAHQKTLPLVISAKTTVKCENVINKGSDPAPFCFMVEIDNVILRMLIGNIKLSYDKQHRLQEFNGTVNIQDEKQKSQSAIIRYYYNNDYITPST